MSAHDAVRRLLRAAFDTAEPATPDDVTDALWNTDVGPADYADAEEKYQSAILEQYKLCVEMADRVSARRALANTFFVTLNAAVLTLIGAFWKDRPTGSTGLLIGPLIVLVALCFAWFWLVRSYRQLNSGKFAVIGALERRLPASPYWSAEWVALGEGRDKAKYWPLTHLEQWVPCLFAASYIFAFVAVVVGA
jgi:hypothetical protein